MHEMPIAQNIFNIVLEEANKIKAHKILNIKIVVGEFSYIVPQCIQTYLDFLCVGTIAEGAKLIVVEVLAKKQCERCKFVMNKNLEVCPKCNGGVTRFISGFEFYIESIEVE